MRRNLEIYDEVNQMVMDSAGRESENGQEMTELRAEVKALREKLRKTEKERDELKSEQTKVNPAFNTRLYRHT